MKQKPKNSKIRINTVVIAGFAAVITLCGSSASAQPQIGPTPMDMPPPCETIAATTTLPTTPQPTTPQPTTEPPAKCGDNPLDAERTDSSPTTTTVTPSTSANTTTTTESTATVPTENAPPTTSGDDDTYPKSEIVPGQMRSDREDVPAPFTKADADEAEVLEASLGLSRAAVGCEIYWPSPNEVCGAIRDLYNFLGGPNSFLLFPKSNELVNPDGYGRRSEFLGGNIYWSAGTGAHYVAHEFLTKWGQYGYESSFMRYPITDEIVNPDGVGRRQQFQGGFIYWSPLSAAHTITGRIMERWAELGYEGGEFGYPTSDELTPTGYWATRAQIEQRFQRGALFYSRPTNTVIDGVFSVTTSAN